VFELPSILTAESLLDKAFGRAAKATATGPDRVGRARNLAVARVRGAGQAIESTLRGYVKGFPSLDAFRHSTASSSTSSWTWAD